MAFTYGQLPMIVSFFDALEKYNTIKPIRGRSPEVRPLGLRRRHEAAISALRDDNGEVVQVNLTYFGHPLISYHRDNPHVATLNLHNNYGPCTTSASFFDSVLGGAFGVRDHDIQFYQDGNYYRVFSGMQVQRDIQTSRLVVLNPKAQTVYRASRKAMKDVVAPYRDFIDYVENMSKIVSEVTVNRKSSFDLTPNTRGIADALNKVLSAIPTTKERQEYYATYTTNSNSIQPSWNQYTLINTINKKEQMVDYLINVAKACEEGDYEAMAKCYNMLAYNAGRVCWVSTRGLNSSATLDSDDVVVRYFDSGNMVVKFFEVLKYMHADKIFKQEELPIGNTVKDNNAKYVLFNKVAN